VMTSRIMVAGVVKGLVVMPPPNDPGPPPNFILQGLGRVLSLPGTGVLLVASALAAFFVFGPARRRLRALEEATDRLGAGDLAARAPESGGDEIARVAWSFNRMARELAAREEAVRESDRLRRQMFADVSHELKTPLTAIRGYLETLRMTELALDAATRDRYLVTAERETMRLDRLVRDLVDLARFENAIVTLNVRPCDVHRLVGLVVERYEGEAQRSQITFTANIAESVDQWTIDPNRIDQALDNLVANAIRHTPTGGSVTIDARATATEAVLEVTDSGEGIPQEHLPYIFDRFYKADAARSGGPSRGSGLGLSIVKAIVERHGGTIQVVSRPGRTCFTITLPMN
jgi:signal transduction histidine kinase